MPYTPEQRRIIDLAMSPAAATTLSPEALQYRSFGTFGQSPQPQSRTLDFGGGNSQIDPVLANFNQQMVNSQPPSTVPTPQSGQTNPMDDFSSMVFDLFKRGQGVDNVELLKRQRALQRASIGRSSELTPEDLRTLSPGQQEAIRSGNVKALEPDIDENAYQLKKAEAMTENFERVYIEAKKLGEDFAEKMQAPDSVIDSYVKVIESGAPIATVLAGLNDKNRSAVLLKVDYSKVRKPGKSGTGTDYNFGTPTPSDEEQPLYTPAQGTGAASPGGQWTFNGSVWERKTGGAKRPLNEYNLTSTSGIVQAVNAGYSIGDVQVWLDQKTRLNADSINALIKGAKNSLPVDQSKQFLTREFLSTTYGEEALKKAAKEAGYKDSDAYLAYLGTLIEQYRKAGYTDQEILKMMQ